MSPWEPETGEVKAKVSNPVGMRVKAPRKPWENVLIRLLELWIKEVAVNGRYILVQQELLQKSVPVIQNSPPSTSD
jgi:hypothetical protein